MALVDNLNIREGQKEYRGLQTYAYNEKMKKAMISHPGNEYTHQIAVMGIQIVPKTHT